MALSSGSRLGPYEVLSPIGAGGMGEVYRATDTRLNRIVPIKVLPPQFADDPDMRQRLEREAQTIAGLNHPNICTLHDVGEAHVVEPGRADGPTPPGASKVSYLVMEFVEGETLADRLSRGPLSIDETLRIGGEIIDALDRAHRQGVDGRRFLFLVAGSEASKAGLFAGSIDAADKTRVMPAESKAVYVAPDPVLRSPGAIVFQREGAVFAHPFDAATVSLEGAAARIADEVTFDPGSHHGHFDVSLNGVLIYYANSTGAGASGEDSWEFQLQWADRSAQTSGPVGPSGVYRGVEVSPDGTRVALHRHDPGGGDIWVIEPPPRAERRITFDATQDNSSPIWSPEGTQIAFASKRNGKWGLYLTQSDGSGTDGELLIESELPMAPMSWSPDRKRLVYWMHDPKTAGDLWILPMDEAAADRKPVPFLASSKNETHAQISPDGKWIAYTSELTGRKEVFVQPFPAGSGRWQISPDNGLGGDWPRWRGDSK